MSWRKVNSASPSRKVSYADTVVQLCSELSCISTVIHFLFSPCNWPIDDWASGTTGSYQKWADQIGDQSYTFDNILPYFEKSPQFTPPDYSKRGAGSELLYDSKAFSRSGGPLQVSYTNFYQPISAFVKRAFLSLGLTNIAGLNSGKLIGFSEFSLTIDPRAGTRSSSETSFLQDSIATSTLQVYQRTLAQKVNFDKMNTATGVNVVTAGKEYTLSATKEVILAAGVVCRAISMFMLLTVH